MGNQFTGPSMVCPICRRPDGKEILEALKVSKGEAELVANVPHATFYRWVDKHNGLPPHGFGETPDPLTASPEDLQRDILYQLMVIAQNPTAPGNDKRVAALKAAGEIATQLRRQAPPSLHRPGAEPENHDETSPGQAPTSGSPSPPPLGHPPTAPGPTLAASSRRRTKGRYCSAWETSSPAPRWSARSAVVLMGRRSWRPSRSPRGRRSWG